MVACAPSGKHGKTTQVWLVRLQRICCVGLVSRDGSCHSVRITGPRADTLDSQSRFPVPKEGFSESAGVKVLLSLQSQAMKIDANVQAIDAKIDRLLRKAKSPADWSYSAAEAWFSTQVWTPRD